MSWLDTYRGGKSFLTLGIAFMWSGVMAAGLDALTRSVVTTNFGVHAAGIYQAAWALSGVFAGFILGAMGTDYYPRLTAVIHDRPQAIRLVNEQTEVGILMALPGLLGTLFFAPLAMKIFYTNQFLEGAELLRWMAIGVFGRVVTWPMGYILAAKGATRWVLGVETLFAAVQVGLLYAMAERCGLVGVAQAFAATYCFHVLVMLWIAKKAIGFWWSYEVKKVLISSILFVTSGFCIPVFLGSSTSLVLGAIFTLAGCIVTLHGLARRVKFKPRILKIRWPRFPRNYLSWFKI
jgi:PST family polysaccharide transporter